MPFLAGYQYSCRLKNNLKIINQNYMKQYYEIILGTDQMQGSLEYI